ncbi:MAG: hypothetical protein K2W82_18205 [Candidatus Obscuribacterales bacterium]|nr:hypothetical protein [Candidatus Obscuribacterales bacterium]
MKALDAYLDIGLDAKLDSRLGFFSKTETVEMRLLRQQFLLDKGQRQSMLVSSSMFAMACPIMPLGFLSIFMALGRLEGLDNGPEALEQKGGLAAQMARVAAAEALLRRRKKDGGESDDDSGYLRYAARQMELRPFRTALSTPRFSDQRVLPKRRPEAFDEKFFVTREKALKTSKLRRKKIYLESLIEKEKEQQDFSEASSISAKIETLDKLLKRLGA